MAAFGVHLYWNAYGAGTVNEAGLSGGDPHTIITGQNHPTLLAIWP